MTVIPDGLPALEARLAHDLELLNQPAPNWIRPREHPRRGPMLDVAIVGGGMAGLAAGFELIREGVRNLSIFDRSPEGREGPWVTYGRMETLRSPKVLTGPALGLPNLTFRAWYEAQHGPAGWEALGKIPRPMWMDYLVWYRRALSLPVENEVVMTGLDGDGEVPVLALAQGDREWQVAARRIVLATGRDGLGGPYVPALFRDLPRRLWAHSADVIDFRALAGTSVAVIGGGASAVDNAAEALEAGAGRVTMLLRRAKVPRVNKGTGVSSPGMNHGSYDLPPARRWAMAQYIADEQVPAPRNSMQRASGSGRFALRTSSPVTSVRVEDGRAVLTTPHGSQGFDFVILGTGFGIDWAQRPELAGLAGRIRLWRDEWMPPGVSDHEFGEQPFLGPAFEFLARDPAAAPWIGRVHCLNFAATLSHGKVTGDIPAISHGAERLAQGVVRSIFVEDYEDHYQRLLDYETPELFGDEWTEEAW